MWRDEDRLWRAEDPGPTVYFKGYAEKIYFLWNNI